MSSKRLFFLCFNISFVNPSKNKKEHVFHVGALVHMDLWLYEVPILLSRINGFIIGPTVWSYML
jgi:hypothetical protein